MMSFHQFTPSPFQIEAFEKLVGPQKSNALWIWLQNAIVRHDSDECLIWPFAVSANTGYGKCRYNGKDATPHRLAFLFTHGHWPIPHARHTCDVPACFNPRHIIEGTAAQNHEDMKERGRQPMGEKHNQAKLTNEIVKQIRTEYIPGKVTRQQLSDKYGVGLGTIKDIVQKKTWTHLL